MMQRPIQGVDLFCGAGGLTRGLEDAGIDVRLGVDIDPTCRYPYNNNNKSVFLLKAIEDVTAEDLKFVFSHNSIRILAGCAPCQTFSTYNQKATPKDRRWWLLLQFSRLVKALSPQLVTMENVPRLENQGIFKEFVEVLKSFGYHTCPQVINCADYGVPQHRHRLVLLASKLGPIRLLSPSETGSRTITVRESIGAMPPLKAGETHQHDRLHQAASLSNMNMGRIKASRAGGTWRDWDSDLIANCHKRTSGRTYPGVYGRMRWDEPAPTITTQFFGFGNGRFGHPDQDRALSLREGAILQGFRKDYQFVADTEPVFRKRVGKLIGNAVPPRLGEVIGLSIIEHIRSF